VVNAGKGCFNGTEFGGGVGKRLVKRVVHIKDGGGAESRGGCFP